MLKMYSLCLLLCFSIQYSPFSSASSPIKVAFINPTPKGTNFWDLVTSFMHASANDLGIKLQVIYTPSHHRNESLKQAKALLESPNKPDFLISIFQKQTTLKLLELTNKNQVHFYSINTQVPDKLTVYAGTPREKNKNWLGQSIPNDKLVGYLMAKDLISTFKTTQPNNRSIIQLIALSGGRDSSASFERNKGLYQALNEHPEVKMNQLVHTDWSTQTAYKKTTGLLKRYPRTNIIWAANDTIAAGAVKAIGDKAIYTAGTDWSKEGIQAVADKQFISTFGGHFVEGGFALVMLYDYFHGKDFIQDPGLTLHTGFAKISLENIDTFTNSFADQNWEKIDFRRFSKIYNPMIESYNFSWPEIFRNIEQ